MAPSSEPVLVAGGGVAGLTLALTCHQIGVPVKVFESVRRLQPLGVGINLQPNAVRELYDLGLADDLPTIGIETKEWALVGRNGNDIWSEPRGVLAGYNWPQFSVHRGRLQMLLHRTVIERLGPDAVATGCRVVGYENTADGVRLAIDRRSGQGDSTENDHTEAAIVRDHVDGRLLMAGDGLRSAVRRHMHPW
ncbi:MAG: FAD-dependent monooxygenase [Acidimicrobiales bacterium]